MKAIKNFETVNGIQAEINRLEAKRIQIESGYTFDNLHVLIEEIMHLLDGVGDGFVDGDHYADSRYYSRIPGVKNIRVDYTQDSVIIVKVTSPIGELLPDSVTVRGERYKLIFWESKYYSSTVDY